MPLSIVQVQGGQLALVDENGVFISAIDDGALKRIAVDAKFASDQTAIPVVIGAPVAGDAGLVVRSRLKNGSSDDMTVDGSSSPAVFSLLADPTQDIFVSEIRFVLVVNDLKFNGGSFGGSNSPLTNGVKLELRSNSTTVELVNLKVNEDFLSFYSPGGVTIHQAASNDVLVAGLYLGGAARIVAGSGDFLKVTIRDNLGGTAYNYFTATVHGVKG